MGATVYAPQRVVHVYEDDSGIFDSLIDAVKRATDSPTP
jgi:hypothetical protein